MNQTLKELIDVSKDPKANYLNASGSRLDKLPPLFLRQFCENIEKTTSIVTLDLSHNDIGSMEEVYLNTLFNAIRKNKSIQEISLISTNLNMLSKINLLKLVKVFEENQSIINVRLDYNDLDKHSVEYQKIFLYIERNKLQHELDQITPPPKKVKVSSGFFVQNATNGHHMNGNGHVDEKTDNRDKIAELKTKLQSVKGALYQLNFNTSTSMTPK